MMNFWLAQFVVAQRIPLLFDEVTRFALGLNGAPKRLEAERMVSEKIDATQAGLLASGIENWKNAVAIGAATATGDLPKAARLMMGTTARLNKAAMAPSLKTLKANAKRFSKV